MRGRFLSVAVSVLLFFVGSTGAHHCTMWTTSQPEIDTGAFYVDNDICQFSEYPCLASIWIYQETNGIPGLQRGDEVKDDTCHGMIDSDTFPW